MFGRHKCTTEESFLAGRFNSGDSLCCSFTDFEKRPIQQPSDQPPTNILTGKGKDKDGSTAILAPIESPIVDCNNNWENL